MKTTLIKIKMNESGDTELTIKGSGEDLATMFASSMYHDKELKNIVVQAAMLCAMREMNEDKKSRMN